MNLTLKGLSYQYRGNPQLSLKDVSLSLDSTRITGLAGANGSGKTTLIRILLGQLVDHAGEYAADGVRINDHHGNIPSRFRIGYSPDVPVLDETLTGLEILRLVAEIRSVDKKQLDGDLALFREHLLIDEWLDTQQCRAYSAGMRKKVSIAIAFLGAVRFAVLDEPLNGLDPLSMAGLRVVARAKREQGVGSLISSHILSFIETSCDDVILLKTGEVRYSGAVSEVYARHPGRSTLEEVYLGLFGKG
jgi:ABC-2 type transport system ATP-binding protein